MSATFARHDFKCGHVLMMKAGNPNAAAASPGPASIAVCLILGSPPICPFNTELWSGVPLL